MGCAQEKSQTASSQVQRVKVYRLNDDGKWDDQGTGYVTVEFLERSDELGLFVIDEEDNETLLLHRISTEDIYRKQEDTIISWRDPEYSTELALSFQETSGCSYIWDRISNVGRSFQYGRLNNDTLEAEQTNLRELPAVELSALPLILKIVSEGSIASQTRLPELILNSHDFFPKLMDLFRISEDLENIESLHLIFKIVRGIILLNSPQVVEKILSDDLVFDIIGSLEYDPDVPHVQHRNFLKEHVIFKEAIPIQDANVLSKIHQTYRVGYLKDVVLARVLDETTIGNFNSIIHRNNAIVVSLLKDDNVFIPELFARLRSPSTSPASQKNLVSFLLEFCGLCKSAHAVQQIPIFRVLMDQGIFDIVTDTLRSPDNELVSLGTDILLLFLNLDASTLRSYVAEQEGAALLGMLVQGIVTGFGKDLHYQFLEILRSLLDTGGSQMPIMMQQRDHVANIFFEKHLTQLVDFIAASCPIEGSSWSSGKSSGMNGKTENEIDTKPEILLIICDLLCFCALHRPARIKCNFLFSNAVEKVLLLMRRREKCFVVAAVRFVRAIFSHRDDDLMNHFVQHNLLKPIVDAFVRNGSRYNLLNSTILELFEFIRKENLKPLLKYIVNSFWSELVKFEHLSSVRSLKLKYEQGLENYAAENAGNILKPRKRIDERALEKEEEEYFSEENEEADSATASASHPEYPQRQSVVSNGGVVVNCESLRSGGLVDYDDDDDEDYRPPPRKRHEASEDEGNFESLKSNRKLRGMERDLKKPRWSKISRSRESFLPALRSSLGQLVPQPDKVPPVSAIGGDEAQENIQENNRTTDPSASGGGGGGNEVALKLEKSTLETPVIGA